MCMLGCDRIDAIDGDDSNNFDYGVRYRAPCVRTIRSDFDGLDSAIYQMTGRIQKVRGMRAPADEV